MLLEVASTVATKQLIEKGIEKALAYFSKTYSIKSLSSKKDKYIQHCNNILNFRTLSSPEKDVFIDDIYVSLVLKGINSFTVEIKEDVKLESVGSGVLIKGLAGQGKSTLLRKLFYNNIKSGNKLPIFFELKKYKGGSIESELIRHFSSFGLELELNEIEKVLDDSDTILFLDAFDEVSPDHRDELLEEYIKVIQRYNCRFISTTRPDTVICNLPNLDVFEVEELTLEQVFKIIHKSTVDSEKAEDLCSALSDSRLFGHSDSILKTPILVILYSISYNLGDDIPNNITQFYSNIFDTVFFKHDNLKSKVRRERLWNDNRKIYRDIFDSICFYSQKDNNDYFKWSQLETYFELALDYFGENKKQSGLVAQEIKSITNLIIEDGFDRYRFVHKSIQEFFSASFVLSFDKELKEEFYKGCAISRKLQQSFSNTLFFLEEMDYIDYSRYYLIPLVSDYFDLDSKPFPEEFRISDKVVDDFLDTVVFEAYYKESYDKKVKKNLIEKELKPIHFSENPSETITSDIFSDALEILKLPANDKLITILKDHGTGSGGSYFYLNLRELVNITGIKKEDIDRCLESSAYVNFYKKYNKAVNKVEKRKASIIDNSYLSFL